MFILEDSNDYQVCRACVEHTCSVEDHYIYHKQAIGKLIGEIMKPSYSETVSGPRPSVVQWMCLNDRNIPISYWKAWSARGISMERARGSAGGSYSLLPAYLHAFKVANPGSLTGLETTLNESGNHMFKFTSSSL